MSKFVVKTTVSYPKEQVFKSFITVASQGFNKFNEENPIGAKSKRAVRKTKNGNVYMETEVSGFIKGQLYETSGLLLGSKYKSTFKFKEMTDETTEVTLIEVQEMYGFFNKVSFIFQNFTAKRKIQKKLNKIANVIEEQIIKEAKKKENKKNK